MSPLYFGLLQCPGPFLAKVMAASNWGSGRSGRLGGGWDKPDRDNALNEWAVAKKAVKEDDEGEEWDAPRKKTIDERDNLRTRADSYGHDPGRSTNCDSRHSAVGGGGRAARASLDDEWDAQHARQAAVQRQARSSVKVRAFSAWDGGHEGIVTLILLVL